MNFYDFWLISVQNTGTVCKWGFFKELKARRRTMARICKTLMAYREIVKGTGISNIEEGASRENFWELRNFSMGSTMFDVLE